MEKFEIKASFAVDDAGTIAGIAWPFGTPDRVGDIIQKGAFNVAVADLPMLLGHNPEEIIGLWDEVKETSEGLTVKGRLNVNESSRARAVRGLIQGGLISGLSIGFKTKAATKNGRNRVISALDLLEVSVVRNPVHLGARIVSAKSATAAIAEAINRAAVALRKR
jgi:HK97 family phage prohead protease